MVQLIEDNVYIISIGASQTPTQGMDVKLNKIYLWLTAIKYICFCLNGGSAHGFLAPARQMARQVQPKKPEKISVLLEY